MAIYIDPPAWPAHGTYFSHMVSDTSYIEVRRCAAKFGLPDGAFDQDHYDVPARLYEKAIESGAIPVEGGELIRILRESGLRVAGKERSERLRVSLAQKWAELFPTNPALGENLLERWCEPHRRYHTLLHLSHCLESLEFLSRGVGFTEVPREALLAAWFHDAVYKGVAGQDEEQSAELAHAHLGGTLGAEVARLVLLTQDHSAEAGDVAGELLVDADLAILSSTPEKYNRYVHQVRNEYGHVGDADWAVGRSAVLRRFLGKKDIYRSGLAQDQWEGCARRNLTSELQNSISAGLAI